MKKIYSKIQNRIIQSQDSILYCMKKMDEESVKLLFVFDKSQFVSIITIGDIQRAIIKNIPLNKEVSFILDYKKIYATPSDDIAYIKKKMLAIRAECMPIVDKLGNLVNVIFWKDVFNTSKDLECDKINLPVIIMAGGKGTRLKPLTNVIPKPLIPIGDKTILETILDKFESIGCSCFYLSVNYKYDILKYYLDNLEHKYNIEYFKEEKPLGTIGSVSLLKGKIDSSFFVSNCDILIDQDFRDVYDYHLKNKNEITIVTSIKSYKIPYGVIDTVEDGLIERISEKPDITYKINTGVYILQPELIDEIPSNEFYHITQLIEKVRKRGGRIGCFPVSEKSWTDIGDWNEYLKLIK